MTNQVTAPLFQAFSIFLMLEPTECSLRLLSQPRIVSFIFTTFIVSSHVVYHLSCKLLVFTFFSLQICYRLPPMALSTLPGCLLWQVCDDVGLWGWEQYCLWDVFSQGQPSFLISRVVAGGVFSGLAVMATDLWPSLQKWWCLAVVFPWLVASPFSFTPDCEHS